MRLVCAATVTALPPVVVQACAVLVLCVGELGIWHIHNHVLMWHHDYTESIFVAFVCADVARCAHLLVCCCAAVRLATTHIQRLKEATAAFRHTPRVQTLGLECSLCLWNGTIAPC